MSRVVEIRDLSARIERLAAQITGVRVRLIHTEQGCFANRTLREQLNYFLTRAAKRGPR